MAKKNSSRIETDSISKSNSSNKSQSSASKPLSSTSHTLQLSLFLILQPILLSICLLILPQGILHSLPSIPKSFSLFSSSTSTSNETLIQSQGPIHGITHLLNGHLGSVSGKMWLALQGTGLVQAWWTAAIKGWINKDTFMRRGDREALRRLSKRSRGEMLEQITMTVISLPLAVITLSFFILLLGSAWSTTFNKSLLLSIHLTLVALFLPIHLYGLPSLPDWLEKATAVNPSYSASDDKEQKDRVDKKQDLDEDGWTRVFARGSPINATDAIPLIQVIGAFTGAWIGNAGMALDWERPWQEFPVPPILGSILGLTIANLVSFVGYLGDW